MSDSYLLGIDIGTFESKGTPDQDKRAGGKQRRDWARDVYTKTRLGGTRCAGCVVA